MTQSHNLSGKISVKNFSPQRNKDKEDILQQNEFIEKLERLSQEKLMKQAFSDLKGLFFYISYFLINIFYLYFFFNKKNNKKSISKMFYQNYNV